MSSNKNTKMSSTLNTDKYSKSNANKEVEEDEGGAGKSFLFLAANLLVGCFFAASELFYNDGVLAALYFNIFLSLVIVLFYVIIGGLYIYNRNKIKKQIAVIPGVVSRRKAKEMLSNNKYFYLNVNIGLFGLPCIFLVGAMVYSLVFDSPASELIYYPYYMICDFFSVNSEVVTYVSESEYTYAQTTRIRKYSSDRIIKIYDYQLVNFQTSGGELLSLIVDKANLAEVRSFNNTEIKYISRTGVYVP